ncbi:MAG: helix-turn-helix domain-containing protein [Rhodospirillales bacterium]
MNGDKSRGRIVRGIDTAAIREKTGLSQTAFASLLSVPVPTLQKWEQHQRTPTGAARTCSR